MDAKELRSALVELEWSQNSLARRLGVSNTIVSRWTTGQAKIHRFAGTYVEMALQVKRITAMLNQVIAKR